MLHLPVTHLTMKWKISHKWWIKRLLPLDLLFLKLPFAVRPGLTNSRVANLIVLSNCTTKMKVEMISVQGSSVKQWVQAQYTGLVSWVIISTFHLGCKVWTGKCSLVKGVTKQPLLLLSSMLSREKQATPRFLRAAGLLPAYPLRG